jgi:hypothetical protein
LQDLDEAARKFLAWESILDEKDKLDLSPNQVQQAETQKAAADGAVTARLPETYQWLLVPTQATPQAPDTWQTIRLSGNHGLAERASKKLRNDELLVTNFAASRLRMEMDRVPLWPGNHVPVRKLVEDFRALPLPAALKEHRRSLECYSRGTCALDVAAGRFAYAESYDESESRYRGLRSGVQVPLTGEDAGLLVRPDVARQQMDAETIPVTPIIPGPGPAAPPAQPITPPPGPAQAPKPRRYHGTVILDPARVGRDASRIAEEVVTHLAGLDKSSVHVTLEIEGRSQTGLPTM